MGCPTGLEAVPHLCRNRAPPFIEIPPHFNRIRPRQKRDDGNEMMRLALSLTHKTLDRSGALRRS